jgi:N-acyl-D-aspartate/D-glutamate deacylase
MPHCFLIATKARNHEGSFSGIVPSLRVLAAIGCGTTLVAQPSSPRFDLIIRHGTVIDGSGFARYRGDVAIVNGFVARVGNLSNDRAAAEIDATGLFVAPGFINIHSHASVDALPTAENMLTQGVTTEILNPDGGGGIDLTQQLARARAAGLALNVGAYIGFNSVWTQVMGPADRRPSPDEIERMRALVVKGLEAGAWGVSAGLDYKPKYTICQ